MLLFQLCVSHHDAPAEWYICRRFWCFFVIVSTAGVPATPGIDAHKFIFRHFKVGTITEISSSSHNIFFWQPTRCYCSEKQWGHISVIRSWSRICFARNIGLSFICITVPIRYNLWSSLLKVSVLFFILRTYLPSWRCDWYYIFLLTCSFGVLSRNHTEITTTSILQSTTLWLLI